MTEEQQRFALVRAPGSSARNERGTLGVQNFKRIGQRVWPKEYRPVTQDRASGAAGNDFGRATSSKDSRGDRSHDGGQR